MKILTIDQKTGEVLYTSTKAPSFRYPPHESYLGGGTVVVGCGKTKREQQKALSLYCRYHKKLVLVSGHIRQAYVFKFLFPCEFVLKVRDLTEKEERRCSGQGTPVSEYINRVCETVSTSKEARLEALRMKKMGLMVGYYHLMAKVEYLKSKERLAVFSTPRAYHADHSVDDWDDE